MSKTKNKIESHKFKLNDWIFSEFKLKQVKEMDGNKVTSVTDGYCISGYNNFNDQIFHMDIKIKNISDTYGDCYDRFSKLEFNSLNYPEIHSYFVDHWIKTCEGKDNDDFVKKQLDDIYDFTNRVCNAVDDILYMEVEGIRVCR